MAGAISDMTDKELLELVQKLPEEVRDEVAWLAEHYDAVVETCVTEQFTGETQNRARELARRNHDAILCMLAILEAYRRARNTAP